MNTIVLYFELKVVAKPAKLGYSRSHGSATKDVARLRSGDEGAIAG